MKTFLKDEWPWLLPLFAMALITPFTPMIDLKFTHFFYDSTQSFPSTPFYTFLYNYGIVPGQIVFGFSAVLLFLASFFKRWSRWYSASLIMVLTLAIGSGLITHILLKDQWGRPRPKQVIEFGGTQEFRPYYKPNFFDQPETSKGFPCGHCTMGFYFFALALIARRNHNRTLFWGVLIFALLLGTLLSWTRIAQGGHFLSDTLASALIMWLTAYACVRLIGPDGEAVR